MSYFYNPKTDRFHKEGSAKYVSRVTVRGYVNDSIQATSQIMVSLDTSDPDKWLARMRAEIKAESIRSYLAGRGGVSMMTKSDWGRVGAAIAEQYRYLDGLHSAMVAGEAVNVAGRTAMYINSAREMYERGLNQTMRGAGRKRVRWNTSGGPNTCDDCKELAGRGWMSLDELPTFPGAGATRCLTNCGCHLDYE